MKMETIEDVVSEQLGNSTAMREALEAYQSIANSHGRRCRTRKEARNDYQYR